MQLRNVLFRRRNPGSSRASKIDFCHPGEGSALRSKCFFLRWLQAIHNTIDYPDPEGDNKNHHDDYPLNDFPTLLRRFLHFPPKKIVAQSPNEKCYEFLPPMWQRPTGRRPWGLLRRAGCSVSSTTDLILEVALDRVGFMTHDIPWHPMTHTIHGMVRYIYLP